MIDHDNDPATPAARFVLCGDFEAHLLVDGHWQPATGWSPNFIARRVAAFLAVQPSRRAPCATIQAKLWPDTFSAPNIWSEPLGITPCLT